MKRTIGMVAAMALATSTAAFAQNTLPEIHQYFTFTDAAGLAGPNTGGALTSPADWVTNPARTVTPGTHVFMAVWIRMLQGNSADQLGLTQYQYEITGQGSLASFTAGGRRQRTFGNYADNPGTPTPANAAQDYTDLPGVDSQLFGASGANSLSGNQASINSAAPGDIPGTGAYLVQVIELVASSTPGTLNLYFTTPATGANIYQTANGSTSGVGSLTTLAFGATASGSLDQKRASAPTADIVGSALGRVSTTPDAILTVVPEPGTLGLLAIGLLGLRRRRSC